ncbi:hypothetical protein [Halobacillus seohaensis]|uniref:SLH domain-containing protein n=1 Tax=Halobacillus seohaensis TaxID=447421 RepID=A0ABW2EKM8_9BACI
MFQGKPDGNFGVGEPLTREQSAIVAAKILDYVDKHYKSK